MIPLKVNNLVKDYGKLRAVDHVSFEVQEGEIFGLLGPNGAGKTSVISTIVTLESPTLGSVEVFGNDVSNHSKQAKAMTGVVHQEVINHGYFTAKEILQFHSGYYGIWKNEEHIDYLLKRLTLWDHRNKKVKQLSGGMKRRLMIAKALVHKPKLLLLDEPTAGVDIELRASLWEFVSELKNQGVSILLTTHYLEEAEELCDRVGILDHGELKQVGSTKALIRGLTQREVRFELAAELDEVKHSLLVSQTSQHLTFKIPSTMPLGELLAELSMDVRQLVDMQIREGSLEDAFRQVLGGRS